MCIASFLNALRYLTSIGTHSEFQSPQKPDLPSLRQPNNQPYFFSDAPPSSPPKSTTYRTPSFTTPRKPFDVDFSSPPDDSSPLAPTDNEDTPEARPLPIEFKSGVSKPEKRKSSLFGIYNMFAADPDRSEPRKINRDAIVRRIHKKRRRAQEFDRQLMHSRMGSFDGSDDESAPDGTDSKPKRPPVEEVGWITALFTFIHTYPDAPYILAKYMQMFFFTAVLSGILYMLWSVYAAIQGDVDRASQDAMAEVLSEMAACSKNYIENRCAANTRLPALETVCNNWELCMNRDPNAVKRASVSARTFAVIFNEFVDTISLKTTIVLFGLVGMGLLASYATPSTLQRQQSHPGVDVYRHPSGPHASPQYPHGQFALPPSTPYSQQQPQLGWQEDSAFSQRQLEYSRSPSKDHRSRSRSPQKKRIQL